MSVRSFLFGSLMTLLAVTLVYGLKYNVERLQGARDQLRLALTDEETRIVSLRAEWAWLTRPERLEQLARNHTELRPSAPMQIVPRDLLPSREPLVANLPSWTPAAISLESGMQPSRSMLRARFAIRSE